jgi:CPA2 family monovalent cation:H+ antiporter-2
VGRAATLILSASGLRNAGEIIRLARGLNPGARVLVRCTYLRELPALRKAGADGVFSGEGEVALAMAESVLRELGAVPEQIDRERERVRAELFEGRASPGGVASPAGQSVADDVVPATAGRQQVGTQEGGPQPGAVVVERGGTPPAQGA